MGGGNSNDTQRGQAAAEGATTPGEGHGPLTRWAKCFGDAETWGKKPSAGLPPTEGHRNTAQERSQPMSQTERGVSRNGSQGYTWEHQAGSNGRAFWSTLRPRDRSTPTSHRRHPCTARTPWAGPMPGPPSLCPKGKSSKSMPTRPRAGPGPRAMRDGV